MWWKMQMHAFPMETFRQLRMNKVPTHYWLMKNTHYWPVISDQIKDQTFWLTFTHLEESSLFNQAPQFKLLSSSSWLWRLTTAAAPKTHKNIRSTTIATIPQSWSSWKVHQLGKENVQYKFLELFRKFICFDRVKLPLSSKWIYDDGSRKMGPRTIGAGF